MKPKTITIFVGVLVTVAAALGAGSLLRNDAAEPVTVAQGEVELRVAGPGTVQARVPVTISARMSAQVVSLHADHGDLVKRGQLLAVLDDRDVAAERAPAAAARGSNERNAPATAATPAKTQS